MIEITQVVVTGIECDGSRIVGIITRPQMPKNAILLTKTVKGDSKLGNTEYDNDCAETSGTKGSQSQSRKQSLALPDILRLH